MKTENEAPMHIGQPSVDSQLLAKKLATVKPGDTITYEQLAEVVSLRTNDPKFKGYLLTARKMVLRTNALVIEPLGGDDRGVGLVCLSDEQKVSLATPVLRRIGRMTRRAARKIITADYEKLSDEGKREFNKGLSLLGTMEMFTKPKTAATIENASAAKRISFDETMKLFVK